MKPVLSRAQVRHFEELATAELSLPSLILMENAGRGAADIVLRESRARGGSAALVVAGTGNNGGDGMVLARRLLVSGLGVELCLVGEPERLTSDARVNYAAWTGAGQAVLSVRHDEDLAALDAALGRSGIVVDALFGTGLRGVVHGVAAQVIARVNQADVLRYSLDVPSGLDADTGAVLGGAVLAHHTITFGHAKLGLLTTSGHLHAGEVHVTDIGVPPNLVSERAAELLEPADVARHLLSGYAGHARDTHKSARGRVMVVAGSPGTLGAALLTARGALRAGAGLVTIVGFEETCRALDTRVLEVMTARVRADSLEETCHQAFVGAHALAIGPGLGLGEAERGLVEHTVFRWSGPKVLDADGLSHYAGAPDRLKAARGDLVLTPHPGEMGRLLGIETRVVEMDRWAALESAVARTNATVLLKGPRTLIGSPGALPVVNTSGSPALATAGSGDVLSGIVAALLCHLPPRAAAYCAAYLHGRAAERWSKDAGIDRGLLAHEVADRVPEVLAELTQL